MQWRISVLVSLIDNALNPSRDILRRVTDVLNETINYLHTFLIWALAECKRQLVSLSTLRYESGLVTLQRRKSDSGPSTILEMRRNGSGNAFSELRSAATPELRRSP
jgi:hypothetical protein